mgnify:FL=1
MQKVLLNSVLILVMGCSQPVEECVNTSSTNYDSLFNLGDSVLGDYYVSQAKQRMYHDSLRGEVFVYQVMLSEKQIKEQKERIIYKDTIIYRKRIKTIIDTIRKHIYLTDTIRDTIFVTKRELKRKRK